jgi:hypothetical protein
MWQIIPKLTILANYKCLFAPTVAVVRVGKLFSLIPDLVSFSGAVLFSFAPEILGWLQISWHPSHEEVGSSWIRAGLWLFYQQNMEKMMPGQFWTVFVCVLGIELRDSCLLDKYSTTTCSHFAFTLFFREALELLLGVGWRECDSHCHPPTCTYWIAQLVFEKGFANFCLGLALNHDLPVSSSLGLVVFLKNWQLPLWSLGVGAGESEIWPYCWTHQTGPTSTWRREAPG